MGKTLVGKWVFIDDGEYYRIGCVTTMVGNDYCLVRMRPAQGPSMSNLIPLDQFLGGEGKFATMFFDTEEELDDYVKWLEKDDRPKVVGLIKR